jgi:hypothetical protein
MHFPVLLHLQDNVQKQQVHAYRISEPGTSQPHTPYTTAHSLIPLQS